MSLKFFVFKNAVLSQHLDYFTTTGLFKKESEKNFHEEEYFGEKKGTAIDEIMLCVIKRCRLKIDIMILTFKAAI